ncbi:hypothetical protein [Pseudomonas lini]|jgi:hypothetical protein|uniref:hypothetical protein n=1 Tax=Pseudomonas lini TaxID=163011 RepID=UPI0006827681|nr:hypothetical protein [Pseudomonas lini]KNH45321.1 hypothetical protein ACS73_16885 [Pseudomonas lini]
MNSAKQIFLIAAVVVLIGWIATGWSAFLFLALALGLFGSIGSFESSSFSPTLEAEATRSSVVVTDVTPIKPAELALPGRAIVTPTTEGAVRPSGRRLFLDDVTDK